MRRWIEFALCAMLANACIGYGGDAPSYPALRQDRHASKGRNNAQATNEMQTAMQIAVHQLIAEALKEAQHIPTADERLIAYQHIAEAEARAGDVNGARKSIETVEATLAESYEKSGGGIVEYSMLANPNDWQGRRGPVVSLPGSVANCRVALGDAG